MITTRERGAKANQTLCVRAGHDVGNSNLRDELFVCVASHVFKNCYFHSFFFSSSECVGKAEQ